MLGRLSALTDHVNSLPGASRALVALIPAQPDRS